MPMFTSPLRTAYRRFAARRRRSRAARAGAVAVACLALVLSLPGTATAAAGDLDPTFSGDGRVLTDFGSDFDSGNEMAQAPDGRLVVAGSTADETTLGDFAVARYNPDGSLDTTFGGDGRVTTDISGTGMQDEAYGVAVQPDRKVVVVGSSWKEYENCCWFTLVRYNENGTLDTTFGGDGVVTTDFGSGPNEAYEVVLRPDGRILAMGTSGGRFALAQFNPDGSRDTTFGGGDGEVTTDPAPESAEEGGTGRTLTLQFDGKIVAGGDVGTTRFDFALIRYNTDGSLDTTFDGDGIVRTDFGDYEQVEALAVQSDGKIVAAGGVSMARYMPNGSLDTGFDGDGRVTLPAPVGDMVLASGGKIVLAGSNGPGGDFAVLRHNPNGSPDTTFGGDGMVTTDFGGADSAHGLILQSDAKIVAAGGGGPDGDFALARYDGGGTEPPPPPPARADLSVSQSGTTQLSLGNRATYTVRVANASGSTASATGITLSDTVSGAGATLVSATTSSGSCTTTFTSANCTLSSLLPGASATVTVTVEPRSTGTVTNRATVAAMEQDPVPANNTATATTAVNNRRGCTIIGTSAGETIVGTNGNDVICGLGGNDTIRGGNGSDVLYGDVGNDNVDGGNGNDTLYGGAGNDTLTGSYGFDRLNTVDGVSGNDTANGGPDFDTCTTDSGDTRINCP